jgi:glycosyltransferase involved in cell wall biosynthesis
VIGDGEQANNLRRIAGPTIKFLGFLPDDRVREEFAHCRAFLFPGEDDLGATPVEAQSFGRPVIAYARGGVLDTVNGLREGENLNSFHSGVFFDRQDVRSMVDAILLFEKFESQFCREIIRERVLWFGEARFRQEMYNYVEQCYADFATAERTKDLAGVLQGAPGVV